MHLSIRVQQLMLESMGLVYLKTSEEFSAPKMETAMGLKTVMSAPLRVKT